jgi:hypothetical protein
MECYLDITPAVLIRLGDALGVPGWALLKEAQEEDAG